MPALAELSSELVLSVEDWPLGGSILQDVQDGSGSYFELCRSLFHVIAFSVHLADAFNCLL